MTARRRGLTRQISSKAKRRSLRVFTEGKKTEPLYLTHWVRLHRETVLLSLSDFHGTPMALVERAVDEKISDARAAKRRRGDPYDQYWCVFDIDIHPLIDEALECAARNGIEIAFSNPCVELWFLLHFRDQNAYIEREDVQRQTRELLGCGKLLTPEALSALQCRHDEAVSRAQALDKRHDGDGSPFGSNPSSTLWRLVEQIRSP